VPSAGRLWLTARSTGEYDRAGGNAGGTSRNRHNAWKTGLCGARVGRRPAHGSVDANGAGCTETGRQGPLQPPGG
jgi:hypothetical protein